MDSGEFPELPTNESTENLPAFPPSPAGSDDFPPLPGLDSVDSGLPAISPAGDDLPPLPPVSGDSGLPPLPGLGSSDEGLPPLPGIPDAGWWRFASSATYLWRHRFAPFTCFSGIKLKYGFRTKIL